MKPSVHELADRYFEYVAKQFPVMCASDEFHFLPRAQAACRYYDRLEDLEAGSIENCLQARTYLDQDLGAAAAVRCS